MIFQQTFGRYTDKSIISETLKGFVPQNFVDIVDGIEDVTQTVGKRGGHVQKTSTRSSAIRLAMRWSIDRRKVT